MKFNIIAKYTYRFIIALTIVGAIACTKTLDLNIDSFESSISIFGVLEADSVPKLFITESEPYYTYIDRELNYQLIENATVTITDGNNTWPLEPGLVYYIPTSLQGEFWGSIGEVRMTESSAFTADMRLKPNTTYTINVTKNNTTATAKTTVIGNLGSFDALFREELIDNSEGNSLRDVIDVNFNSKAYGQFYRILIKQNRTTFGCDDENDIVFTFNNEYVYYNGYEEVLDSVDIQNLKIPCLRNTCYWKSECTVNNYCNGENYFNDFVGIDVAVQVLDSSMVKFINQLQWQEEVSDDPFLEPAPVDHKVENGIGILSSTAFTKWKKLRIPCN